MPHYGHLIMNATYRAPMDYKNESRLIFAERRNGQTTIKKLTDPNQMITNYGTFFVSEALGGVLKMKYGSVACNLMWDDYQEPLLPFEEIVKRQQCPEIHLESDMIAVGTIINTEPNLWTHEQRYGVSLYKRLAFHCFSDDGVGGQFISDTTPDTTEYEGYFNVAENIQYSYFLRS
ncbi:PREDICTED: ester hydrolase C11orf54 homolog [Trachymyrmex septentrionalis]|uniref:ester hydrolase C11orf54 homolog n=1 Tax=Trachymyrmex septentrionalis TaxID=34720 RepID=UPI00084EF9C5|nr:PREDICTED: ester hydrolase C11orf54 homolog [Trachymyrmex septentrionalis]